MCWWILHATSPNPCVKDSYIFDICIKITWTEYSKFPILEAIKLKIKLSILDAILSTKFHLNNFKISLKQLFSNFNFTLFLEEIHKYIANIVSIKIVTKATPTIPYPSFTTIISNIRFSITASMRNTKIFVWLYNTYT